jgi:hypothetical protein
MHKKGYLKLLKDRINAVKYGKKFFYCPSLHKVFFAKDLENAKSKYTGYNDIVENPNLFLRSYYLITGKSFKTRFHNKKFFYCKKLNKVFLSSDLSVAKKMYTGHEDSISQISLWLALKYFVLR